MLTPTSFWPGTGSSASSIGWLAPTHADRFVLKGAMLLRVWLGETARPTRDADLLGYGDLSTAEIERIFRQVCGVAVEPDGVSYRPTR